MRRFLMLGLPCLLGAFAAPMASAAVAAKPGNPQADLEANTEAARMAREHRIAEVREAIDQCRRGEYAGAIPTLKKHAGANDIGATYVLAKLYHLGLGVERSPERATELLNANVAAKHGPSILALAEVEEQADPPKALARYKQAAAAGETIALVKLAAVYENGGLGVKTNPALALRYYKRASESGHPLGDYHLARFYDAGKGVSANAIEATRLYRKAAINGVAAANAIMAQRYFEGKGLEQDPIAAIGWLVRGTQQGAPEAMVLLGERYERGDAFPKDLNRAGELYSRAAKMGDAAGTFKLAMMYLNGVGTKADPVRAYVLLSGIQTLPKAKETLDQIGKELTEEQMAFAQEKLRQARTKDRAPGD